jgi:farnesyl-diphosphate farnesyltransferase
LDTVEDEVSLTIEQKEHFCSSFIEVVRTGEGADVFARDLAPLLSEQTIPTEHVLIQLTSRVRMVKANVRETPSSNIA